jgi:hypothetical protein
MRRSLGGRVAHRMSPIPRHDRGTANICERAHGHAPGDPPSSRRSCREGDGRRPIEPAPVRGRRPFPRIATRRGRGDRQCARGVHANATSWTRARVTSSPPSPPENAGTRFRRKNPFVLLGGHGDTLAPLRSRDFARRAGRAGAILRLRRATERRLAANSRDTRTAAAGSSRDDAAGSRLGSGWPDQIRTQTCGP